MATQQQSILIVDFGSQYTQLIARRIRELEVFCEIHPYDMNPEVLSQLQPKGVILSGGPESVAVADGPAVADCLLQLGVPVLGICYGMQALAQRFGGTVSQNQGGEFGHARVTVQSGQHLLTAIEDHVREDGCGQLDVWMSHGDQVTSLPSGFNLMASTDSAPVAGFYHNSQAIYGLQFHPEVTHTRQGTRILERFVKAICQCQGLWSPDNIIHQAINSIRQQVGSERVLLALSGGVDSSVVAALMDKAIGRQLTCIFVDNGLLRQHEADQVMAMFAQHKGMDIRQVDAQEIFLQRLAGITDPEQKRKIIGQTFIEVFAEQADHLENISWLAQGTIYPDVIESAAAKTNKAQVIKSHHNVGGLPEQLPFKLIEPLRDLFKDEVRRIGLDLGLPYDRVYRHPFPGPGLAVRVMGQVTAEALALLRQADAIFIEELLMADWYQKVSQAFVLFLPVKSVGVTGDGRCYGWVVALRTVVTTDFMTADWAPLPTDLLAKVASRIINEVKDIARVTYDISSKPPATIEWE
jgi:GMP synthase (glutamine-hydrolysing)